MKIYVVVKYTDVETIDPMTGELEVYITQTELIEAYGNSQDANFERGYLNRTNDRNDVVYDVEVLELN